MESGLHTSQIKQKCELWKPDPNHLTNLAQKKGGVIMRLLFLLVLVTMLTLPVLAQEDYNAPVAGGNTVTFNTVTGQLFIKNNSDVDSNAVYSVVTGSTVNGNTVVINPMDFAIVNPISGYETYVELKGLPPDQTVVVDFSKNRIIGVKVKTE